MSGADGVPPYAVARACAAEVDAVHALLAAAGTRLAERGFRNWLPHYPRERVAADVADGVVFLVRDPGDRAARLRAVFTLRAAPVRPYLPPPWPEPDAPARYLNRIAVHPGAQGRGLGAWCLAWAVARAEAEGARALRCDVLAANAGLRAFYERAGFVARGTRTHSGWTFACYERALGQARTHRA